MASLGDIKRQLSILMNSIKAHGFKFEDVMPDEMQHHFQDMTALSEAHAYIKEVETNETELEAANASLRGRLQAKQAEIDNQPEEFKALKVDLQQSERRIDYYKKIAEHEQSRAELLERKLVEANNLQSAANNDARKIQRLEQNLKDCEVTAFKLLEENRRLTDQFEVQEDESIKLIGEKEAAVSALRDYANKLEAEKLQVDEDSEETNNTLGSIIDTLEDETRSAAEVANSKSAMFYSQRDFNDQLFSTIVSELGPLNRFYDRVTDILGVYQSILKNLSDPHSSVVASTPRSIHSMLESANDQLYAYREVSANLRTEFDLQKFGLAQEAVISQVDNIANVAARLYTNLDTFKVEMSGFVDRLRNEPDAWDRNGSGLSTPMQSIASSRSSISSFASFTKRFSISSR
jgi:chromosome segregation ATPase